MNIMNKSEKTIEELLMGKKNKPMLSTKVQSIINAHIASELEAAYIYQAMYAWCEYKGYTGAAKFFNLQYYEELEHMQKLYKYMTDRMVLPKTPTLKQVPMNYSSLKEVVSKALEHEILVEEGYKASLQKVWAEKDMTTFSFLQWFAEEQIEEVATFSNLVDRLTIAGNDSAAILEIDEEMGKRS